jgi:mono/diheme cytochrome c family protein
MLPGRSPISIFPLVVAFALGSVNGAKAAPGFAEILPVLDKQCFKCHNAEKEKGGVDLARYKSEEEVTKGYKVWRRVLEQLETGEMPPEEDKITSEERRALIAGVKGNLARLNSGDPSMIDPGPALVRRLSRLEYTNVIRDLTGLELNINEMVGMPEDSTGLSYDNVATALNLAPALMEKYFAAADIVLGKLFGEAVAGVTTGKRNRPKADTGNERAAREKFFAELAVEPDRAAAEAFVAKFARRAWRRPIESAELDRLIRIYDRALADGESGRPALRKALKPVLVSPYFLYRVEEDRKPDRAVAGARPAAKISDIELATRLSFFLWSSIPDDELLQVAEAGTLSDPEALRAQVTRMLSDPKARALSENFFVSWLQVRKLDEARPTTEFFPTFNSRMKEAMRQEVLAFADHLRLEDRSLLDLLNADYTFVNADLAKHYGLKGVTGKELERVLLKPEDNRGGVLGMGAVLASTSHTNRTSPSQRGRWVLDVVLGAPPPPPPPDAGQFKDEGRKKQEPKDFREKLAQHAEDVSCAGCHRKMDPLGFGLDNYDPVGQWRPSSPENDTSGELPSGEKFSGTRELKKIIWERREVFIRNFTTQMFTFAMGRETDYFDEGQITKIHEAIAADGYRFSSLIHGIVTSYPFQYRRNAEPVPDAPIPATPSKSTAAN